jgi:hypothetical protein
LQTKRRVTDVILAWLWVTTYALLLRAFYVLRWFEKPKRKSETTSREARAEDT